MQWGLCSCSEHNYNCSKLHCSVMFVNNGLRVTRKQVSVNTSIYPNKSQTLILQPIIDKEFESRCGQIYMHVTNHFSDKQKQTVLKSCW